jgi:hypothetical protein
VGAVVSSQYFRFSLRDPSNLNRSELLERLLARADEHEAGSDWRVDAFRIIAPEVSIAPSVAAAALYADGGPVDGALVCVATPVRYEAEMANVRLPQDGILSLSRAEAEALALDFNRVWNDSGARLIAGSSAALYCVFDQGMNVITRDPQDVLDRHIEPYLPAGADAPRLRQLMSELEMWLFEHVVNRARAVQGQPLINGLWLWGGGSPLLALPSVQGFTAGNDVFFKAFKGKESDAGVVVLSEVPGSPDWQHAESQWLKPAVARLRAGRISRLDLSAGHRCFSVTAAGILRFWRRPKPWWESFA